MLENFRKVARKVSGFIFSRTNANALRMAGATTIDLVTTSINIAAPLIIFDNINSRSNSGSDEHSQPDYTPYVAIGALLTAQVLPKFRNMLLNSVRANVQKELTQAMVVKSYQLELNHQLTERTGEFAQALSKNYSSVDKGIPSLFGEIIPSSIEILGTSSLLVARFGGVGALELATFGSYMLIASILEKRAVDIRNKCVAGSYKGYGDVIAAIGNYLPAHQFGNVDYELNKVNKSLTSSEVLFSQMHRKDDKNALILSAINAASFASILAFAALVPYGGSFNLADFGLITYYAARFNTILNSLAPSISTFHTAMVDSQKVVDFLNKQSKLPDNADEVDFETLTPPSIEFKNVTFRYDGKLVLDDISFRIDTSQKFAIVGSTGAGKSTILNLLLRFYLPESGEILVNRQNINLLTAKSLREHIAVIAQSSTLFNDTVSENIRYGYLAATAEEIRQVAAMAELDPEKLTAIAGQAGGKLSGGERQRVTIARALLKSGPIYVLDEPTRELDPETERDVQVRLDELTVGSTSILVTHRLNTVTNADHIIYLDQAKIAEQGTFGELMRRNGLFANQFNVQCHDLGIDPASVKPQRRHTQASSPAPHSSRNGLNGQTFWLSRRKAKLEGRDEVINLSKNEQLKSPLIGINLEEDESKKYRLFR